MLSRGLRYAGRRGRPVRLIIWGALALTLVLAACGGATDAVTPTPVATRLTFAFVLPDLQNPIFVPMRTGAEAAAKEFGFDLRLVGPQPAGVQGQISLLQDFTQQKVDGLIVVPVDATGVNPAIDAAVAAGIPVATANLDATGSKRAFYYGPDAKTEGALQAKRLMETLHSQGAKGVVNYVITSCLPSVSGQLDRRAGFETTTDKSNPYASDFTLKEVGFFDTSTDPAKNLSNVQNIYTSKSREMQVAYAMCAPDTQNWGKTLKDNNNKNIIVVGHDWLPGTLDLIGEGWVPWSLGESPYDMGYTPLKMLYENKTKGTALPTGAVFAKSIFADKTNLDEIRKSPDAQGS
jgi:ribose transport system substrate-binding protein